MRVRGWKKEREKKRDGRGEGRSGVGKNWQVWKVSSKGESTILVYQKGFISDKFRKIQLLSKVCVLW